MIFTTEMTQLFAVVLAKDSQRVAETLLRAGCMQFVKTTELTQREKLDVPAVQARAAADEVSDLRKRIEAFLHAGGIIPAPPREADLKNRTPVDVTKESAHLEQIAAERAAIRDRQRSIQQEILKLEDIRRQVELYGEDLAGVRLPAKHSLITMQLGKIPVLNARQLERALGDYLSLAIPLGVDGDTAHYVVITMKRDSTAVGKILAEAGWTSVEFPSELRSVNKNVSGQLAERLKALNEEQKKLQKQADEIVQKKADHLKKVWVNLRIDELFNRVQENFEASSRTVIFTGWLPARLREKVTSQITSACDGRCYIEWHEPNSPEVIGDQVPVQFNNPKILAPFQMLVSNFGIPRYGTIDPTAFVMPLYLAMFGLMFADLGQGLVLAALGFLGVSHFKGKQHRQQLRNLCWLIVWCGASAALFGALFGSFFGFGLFKPLWFDFHGIVSGHSAESSTISDVYDVLAITVYFGISVIVLGLVFNWVNLARSRRWMELIFDKGGMLGGWIYVSGVYVAHYLIAHDYRQLPPGRTLFLLVGLPCIGLLVKEPYHFLEHRRLDTDTRLNIGTVLNFLMQWIVELLEIFSGYLSNTLSFMRVAGLGIAHVCLMIAFFRLAEMTSGIYSVIILVLGNILVIGLEGLSAGIQALRLSYYEFFTKFFHGTGQLYTPISLNSKQV